MSAWIPTALIALLVLLFLNVLLLAIYAWPDLKAARARNMERNARARTNRRIKQNCEAEWRRLERSADHAADVHGRSASNF